MYDFSGALIGFGIACGLAGAAAMALALYALPWVWSVVKPLIRVLVA